jgi:hypothetical protein
MIQQSLTSCDETAPPPSLETFSAKSVSSNYRPKVSTPEHRLCAGKPKHATRPKSDQNQTFMDGRRVGVANIFKNVRSGIAKNGTQKFWYLLGTAHHARRSAAIIASKRIDLHRHKNR